MDFSRTYPKAVFCIIATEFCERFSFCGLRTILSIYLRNELLFSENSATVIYHVFIMGCYIVPLAGAICADSVFGRYRTILYFSLIYLAGNILMCMGAIPSIEMSSISLSMIGLILIAIGTGGIKPCVAAFGADQFHLPDQHNLLQHFFSLFYFTINLGGFVGMIITPVLRKWVSCFGEDTCYPLGFGFPAALMFLALSNKSKRKRHWLDPASGKFSQKLIKDMRTVCAVLFLYVPLPIFWSLFDQQGSRWTFQASHMDGNVLGMQIVPDQMQVVNPAMVLILIPFFDNIITKCHVMENSLHRMAIGGMFAGFAFFSAGILELVLETTYPKLPEKRHASINLVNTLACGIKVYNSLTGKHEISSGALYRFENMPCNNFTKYTFVVDSPMKCGNIFMGRHSFSFETNAIEYQIDTVIIGINTENKLQNYVTDPVDFHKSLSGAPRLRVAYVKGSIYLHNITVSLRNQADLRDIFFVHDSSNSYLAGSAYMELPQGPYNCTIETDGIPLLKENFNLALGGVYSLIIRERNKKIEFFKLYTMSSPNTINILWLVPQYFLISVAEILFGVAGLEFSFTQAPKSMKTVTIAGWYLSVAVGNFLVILITQANFFESQAHEFFLFAVIMVADMMIFIEISSDYKFVQLEADSSACFQHEEHMPLMQLTEFN